MTTTSDLGASILNSLGANKFDVTTMATTLAKAEVAAQQSNLDSATTKYNAQLTGFNTLQSAFQGFMSQITTLSTLSSFQQKTVVSSDPTVVGATVTGTPNNGIYQVEVQALASAQSLATSTAFASTNSTVGQGTLTLNVGGSTTNLTIDSTNNTLSGIQNAVNNANIGVNATIVNVGSGYKLMFSSAQTGASNQINVSVSGDADGNNTDALGLSQLINANMTQTVPAQDASVLVNGLAVSSSSNNLTGVIQGVTLNLNSASIGSTKTLQINNDTTGLDTAVSNFVDLYNSLGTIINTLGSYSAPPKQADGTVSPTDQTGALKGDSSLRDVKSQIRQAMIDSIPGLSGSVQSLADIGISTNLDGSLSLDKTMLSSALAKSPDAVGKLFAANATATDSLVTYKGSTTDTIEGTFNLTVNTPASQASITGASMGGGNVVIDNTNNTLQVSVDGATSSTLTLTAGTYAPADLATEIAKAINNDSTLSTAGSHVAVQYDAATQSYTINSDKFGSNSKLSLDSGTLLTSGVAGLAVTAQTVGADVQGSLDQNGNFYTFIGNGKDVTISSILTGSPKGLSFSIDGNQTGARGTIDFNRGYADKLNQLFTKLMDTKTGLIGTKISDVQTKLDDFKAQQTKVDDRYNKILTRYQLQFGALQTLLNQMSNTRQSLASSLGGLTNSTR